MTSLPQCRCGCGETVRQPQSRWRPGHNPYPHERKVFLFSTIRGKGRWYVTAPNNRKTLWARAVMERAIGRQLSSEEVVHHINGDSTDDRLENLQLFQNQAEHMRAEFKTGALVGLKLGPEAQRGRPA